MTASKRRTTTCSCSSGFPVRRTASASRSSSFSSSATSGEYIHRDSDYRIVRDELDSFVELVELPDYTADYSEERALLWFKMYRSYRLFDELGCGGQFFTTGVKLFRRRGRWYAYHFVSVDM